MKIQGDCPNCKEKVSIDIDKLEIKTPKLLTNATAEAQTQILETPKPEIIEKEVIKTVIEDFKPNYECPNGDCDIGVHKNTNYKKMVKGKCSNCDQFTKHNKGVCPWCKKNDTIEEIDVEELEELGIVKPEIVEHEGHNHE